MDMGLDVLSALTSNKPGYQPLLVNGKPLKSINQFYNKRKAELQSRLTGNKHTSDQIKEISNKRNRRIRHYLHVASRQIVDHLVQEEIGVLRLETGNQPGQEKQSSLCVHSSCHELIQGRIMDVFILEDKGLAHGVIGKIVQVFGCKGCLIDGV